MSDNMLLKKKKTGKTATRAVSEPFSPYANVSCGPFLKTGIILVFVLATAVFCGSGSAADQTVSVSGWNELASSISGWDSATDTLTLYVTGDITDRVEGQNTDGIEVRGKVLLLPQSGVSERIINGNQRGRLFLIKGGGELTVADNNGARLALTGGSYSGKGGGVYISESTGRFILSGGSICGCSAVQGGGGVYVSKGTFVMSGSGCISGCKSTGSGEGIGGGGVEVYSSNGAFIMSGGSISGCQAENKKGSGVYVYNGVFTISGTACIETDEVYLNTDKSITLGAGGFAEGSYGAFNIVSETKNTGTTIVDGSAVSAEPAKLSAANFRLSPTVMSSLGLKKIAGPCFAITSADSVTVTGIKAADKEYDGTTGVSIDKQEMVITGVAGGDTVTATVTGAFTDENAGKDKTVRLLILLGGVDAEKYVLSSSSQSEATADICLRNIVVSGVGTEDKEYDGSTSAVVHMSGASLEGVVSGEDVSLTSGTAVFANKNAGTGKVVTFSGFGLSGADACNYILTQQPDQVSADITAKTLTVSGVTAEDKEYDGSTSAVVNTSGASLEGVVPGDDVSLTAGTAAFTDCHAGTGKSVTFSGFGLSGADTCNYILTQQPDQVSADILKRPAEIRVDNSSKIVGSTDPVFTGTVKNLVTPADLGTVTYVREDGEITGTYSITAQYMANPDYAVTVIPGVFTIKQILSPYSTGSTDSGSGRYTEYLRVADGQAALISFGTSPNIKSVDMPEGVKGEVVLLIRTSENGPEGKISVLVFEINVRNYPKGQPANINFEFTRKELEAAGYSSEDLVLMHKEEDGLWIELPTTYELVGNKVKYTAVTTSFSPFAVVYAEDGAKPVQGFELISEQTAEPTEVVTASPTVVKTETLTEAPTKAAASPLASGCILAGLLATAVLAGRRE
ncbi:MAG TPA: YDG domain-containing protein [Methanocorpusculum sp.]|nr:YDG domain-containing protein [Methanocorpusculum sp.]